MEELPDELAGAAFTIVVFGRVEGIERCRCADKELIILKLYDVQLANVIIHSKMADKGLEVEDALFNEEMDPIISPIF